MTQPAMSESYAKMIVDAQLMCDSMRRIGISPNYTTSSFTASRLGFCGGMPPDAADRLLAEAKLVLSKAKTEERA